MIAETLSVFESDLFSYNRSTALAGLSSYFSLNTIPLSIVQNNQYSGKVQTLKSKSLEETLINVVVTGDSPPVWATSRPAAVCR